MIIVDTNVLGELVRPQPSPKVLHWIDRQASDELVTTAITAAEMALGVARMAEGRRRLQIEALNAAVLERLAGILPFSADAAEHYAYVMTSRERLGRRIEPLDAQIAAIALSHGASVATRNVDDFDETGVQVINPWDA
jgi:predicted nucleic acid-binding protein